MKEKSFILKISAELFSVLLLVGCEGKSEEVLSFSQTPVLKFSRDSIVTVMTYSNQEISRYQYYVNDSLVSRSDVHYTSTGISCEIDSVLYSIELERALRASVVEATVGGALWYRVSYTYDDDGYLTMAQLELPYVFQTQKYISYKYSGSLVSIDESGDHYELSLSSEKTNTGNVCSVLSCSAAPLTTKYVINPDLYFLNIYGHPVENLPSGMDDEIEYDNGLLKRVGNFYYGYE